MFHGFLELKADLAKLSNKIDSKEVDTKIGICRYFKSPNGCGRGSKCYYSHGEEAQRLEKSRLVEHNPRLLTCIKVRFHPCPLNKEEHIHIIAQFSLVKCFI
ncbi:hypothetical protein MA16_Dca010649 [Dendrobium catenatum]|uniref:C3H1-type domain-containing protein n=1 Tax=Dendrobium catenatum TaxID=906689 RepID=A0A2I0VZR8_9ASPA|nr:hypothetical protein MA16_Dca010649 [Dendrobium catenatum]